MAASAAHAHGDQLDVDRMNYEELIERFPVEVPKASQETIAALPQHMYNGPGDASSSEEDRMCAICLETVKQGDLIKTLPCLHKFHASEIDEWLGKGKNTCPVCNMRV